MLKIYNSLTKKIEEFVPLNPPQVGMYSCGMTVYDYDHIGHGRKYVNDDILRRTLVFNGFKIKHVQNVTDVGHLTSDADEGIDKLEKGAEKVGKNVWEVAEFFTNHFYASMDKLNVLRPDIICKATDHIKEQIDLISRLFEKGLAYDTQEAVYYDVTGFPDYQKIFGQSLEEKRVAVREEIQTGLHKKNPLDFALWFKRVGRFEKHIMHWDSPWGDGFPGWHIECSAMSMKYLGEQFDIHTGGEDHIPVHHPNEIAQSEGATGKKPFVKYWVHSAFLLVNGQKMSKSLGNTFKIEDVEEKGFDPMSLRYFYLNAHYRKQLNFTWEALEASQKTLNNLRNSIVELKNSPQVVRNGAEKENKGKIDSFKEKFSQAIGNDLNMPQAVSITWEVLKSDLPSQDKLDLIAIFDQVLGLKLTEIEFKPLSIPDEIKVLAQKREEFRKSKDFPESDKIRAEIESKGFVVEDSETGPKIKTK